MNKTIKRFIKRAGVQLEKYTNNDLKRRSKIIRTYKIDTLLDVGANVGRYGLLIRKAGYKGKIISFEPLNSAFEELQRKSRKDEKWIVNNYGLGNEQKETEINISKNSYSSSILNILDTHIKSAPNSQYIAKQKIKLKTLDEVFHNFCNENSKIMMKIDTQGFEKNVLDGAQKSLSHINLLQLEMSLVPLYENEILYLEMIHFLRDKGFSLYSLENGFSNHDTGQLLQVDGIFVKEFH